ncbi:phosphodiesterase, partial [Salmonella enterica]
NPGSVSIPKGGFPASYGMLESGTLRVLTLDDGKVVAEVALTR